MKRLSLLFLVLLILLFLLACDTPTAPEPETEAVAEEAEPEEPEEPPWTPEPWHIYILDAADTILFDYESATRTDYYYMLQAVKLKVELHNRDYEDTWHWIAGGTS